MKAWSSTRIVVTPSSARSGRIAAIGRAATLALYDELALSPKPGLVTLIDRGSHMDMDAKTFMRSLFALRGYFVEMAGLGGDGATFADLQSCGIEAERRMLSATGGINTHRGAIFMLGLLCAAAGATQASGLRWTPRSLRASLLARWGQALRERSTVPSTLSGGIAARRHGLRGAVAEAAAGFPVLFGVGVPALRRALARHGPGPFAHVETLFRIMAVLDDCNLANRGGLAGLRFAQACARDFMQAGGMSQEDAAGVLRDVCRQFVERRLSPGGAADTLAAACWMQRMGLIDVSAEAE